MGKLAGMIESDFRNRKARVVEVPEWDMSLYIFPLTIGQLETIEAEVGIYKQACRAIVTRSKNEDGSPMFDEQDFAKMITHSGSGRFTLKILGRIKREIMADIDEREPEVIAEEREKN